MPKHIQVGSAAGGGLAGTYPNPTVPGGGGGGGVSKSFVVGMAIALG